MGFAVSALLLRRAGMTVKPAAKRILTGVFIVGTVVAVFPHHSGGFGHVAESTTERLMAGLIQADTAGRTELYETALEQIHKDPFIGQGYLSFRPIYRRSGRDLFHGRGTQYVHNDYLQIWLEMGLVGLLGLMGVLVCAAMSTWRVCEPTRVRSAATGCMVGGALAAVATHALVDFPLYTPVIVVLAGLGLGRLENLTPADGKVVAIHWGLKLHGIRVHVVLGTLLSVWWSLPALAGVSAGFGYSELSRGAVKRAVSLYTVARTLAPYMPTTTGPWE